MTPTAASPSRPTRVLIVDDQADSARMLRLLLKREGYETRVELDGESALEAVEAFAPDVVLLDLHLPGIGGFEVAAKLRGLSCPDVKALIAVTGRDEIPEPSPFDRHLVKPIDHSALLAILGTIQAGPALL